MVSPCAARLCVQSLRPSSPASNAPSVVRYSARTRDGRFAPGGRSEAKLTSALSVTGVGSVGSTMDADWAKSNLNPLI